MKHFSIICALMILVVVQLACSLPLPQSTGTTPTAAGPGNTPPPTGTQPPAPTFTALLATPTPAASSISLETLKNFTYTVENGNTQVTLKDGQFQGDHIHSQLIEPAAFGDLNGDGRADAAVILATNMGGSGTFYDLAAVLDQNGAPVQAGFASIGDRQGIKNLTIVNGRMILDYMTQGIHDPFCCPGEHRLRSYLLDNGVIRLASEQVLDSPTAQATPLPNEIVIEQPATTLDFLTSPQTIRGRVSQAPPEMKLQYHVTDINGNQILQGDVPLTGEPGGPATFDFTFDLGSVKNGIFSVEIVDSANGTLRGRSVVVLVPKS